jgi:hypothetical protein
MWNLKKLTFSVELKEMSDRPNALLDIYHLNNVVHLSSVKEWTRLIETKVPNKN